MEVPSNKKAITPTMSRISISKFIWFLFFQPNKPEINTKIKVFHT